MDPVSGNGDLTTGIAATAVQQANTDTLSQANVYVLKKSLDEQKAAAAALLKTMPPPQSINSGSNFDAYT